MSDNIFAQTLPMTITSLAQNIVANRIDFRISQVTLELINQKLQAVEIPPNSTTFKVNRTLLLDYGAQSATIGMNTTTGALEVTTTIGDLVLNPAGSITTAGKTIDMTGGEIHKVPLIHGQTNADITIESLGTGDVILKSGGVNRITVSDTGFITVQGGLTYNNATDTLNAGTYSGGVSIFDDNTATTYYPIFAAGSGSRFLRADITTGPLSYVPSTGVLSAGTFSGQLNGTLNILEDDAGATLCYPTFVAVGGGSYRNVRCDSTGATALSYLPSTSTLSCGNMTATTFTGALTGNASSASVATTVTATATPTGALYYPTFVSATTGNYGVRTNSGLTYDADTNTLTATNFNGTASSAGNAATVTVIPTTTGSTYYPAFLSAATSGNYGIRADTALTFDADTNTLATTTFAGALTGNASSASQVSVTSDNTNATRYLLMSGTTGTGNKQVYQDDTTGPLSYNPSTGVLTAGTFSGSLSVSAVNTNGTFSLLLAQGTASGSFPPIISQTAQNWLRANPSSGVLSPGGINVPVNATNANGTNKYVADFTNGTLTSRHCFQTITANNGTYLTVLPNGTATTSELDLYSSSDPTNTSLLQLYSTNTKCVVATNKTGTGTAQSLSIATNNLDAITISTAQVATFANCPVSNANATGTGQILRWDNFNSTTFTPTVSGSTGGTVTYATQTGTYTQVGKVVTFSADIVVNTTSLTGNITVTAPVANGANRVPITIGTIGGLAATTTGEVAYMAGSSSTTVIIAVKTAAAGAYTALQGSQIGPGFQIVYGGSYVLP